MAQLIPEILALEIKSLAEKRLFIEFRDYQTNRKCIILHSLGIAEHTNNIFGEIDFVIICEDGVLCLEVKGGEVSRTNGTWEFTNRYGAVSKKNESPFQQAQGNMHSLRKYLIRRLGKGKYNPMVRCQYACAVAMPDCRFNASGIDVIEGILFDAKFTWDLDSIINQSFAYWRHTCLEKHGFEGGRLSSDEIDKLANLLRSDFHFVPSLKDLVDRASKELLALTAEQYEVLESLSENPRTLISGVAGAGKTLIAMEQARRAHWEGKRVLYLCYNRGIAQYVSYQFEKEQISIDALTLHAFMMRQCEIEWIPELTADFYEKELPSAFKAKSGVLSYDLIIIDEGQDILRKAYIECIDQLVLGGLQNGNWAIYYDPNQNIFNSHTELCKTLNSLRNETHVTNWKLSTNCRNTKQITNANILMTNISDQGKPKVVGPNVEYESYCGKTDELKKINSIIRCLKNDGVVGSDFIILSRYTLANPQNGLGTNGLDKDLGVLRTTGTLWEAKKNEVRFSTVSAFKGLESKIVVIIDVDHFSDENSRLLNYVAASRACSMLYVLYDCNADQERQRMILSGFNQVDSISKSNV